jgi:hypothetical protein
MVGALAAKRKQLANLSKKIHFDLEYFSTAVITRSEGDSETRMRESKKRLTLEWDRYDGQPGRPLGSKNKPKRKGGWPKGKLRKPRPRIDEYKDRLLERLVAVHGEPPLLPMCPGVSCSTAFTRNNAG